MSNVDWSKAPEWANWAAMDKSTSWYWYERQPVTSVTFIGWSVSTGRYKHIPPGLFNDQAVHWSKSLEQRPTSLAGSIANQLRVKLDVHLRENAEDPVSSAAYVKMLEFANDLSCRVRAQVENEFRRVNVDTDTGLPNPKVAEVDTSAKASTVGQLPEWLKLVVNEDNALDDRICVQLRGDYRVAGNSFREIVLQPPTVADIHKANRNGNCSATRRLWLLSLLSGLSFDVLRALTLSDYQRLKHAYDVISGDADGEDDK